MNKWLIKQAEAAFNTYNTAIAMHLHFTSKYSYPNYNGKTKATVQTLLNRADVGEWIKIHNALKARKVDPEEYFFVWFKDGGSLSAGAIQLYNFEKFKLWKEKYSTKEKFHDTTEYFPQSFRAADAVKKYGQYLGELPIIIESLNGDDISYEDAISFLTDEQIADFENKHRGNFIFDTVMDKFYKIKEYYEWKCIV